jgi:putative membrane protein
MLAGAIGGLAGAFAMNQFQRLWKSSDGGGEDATVKTAELISQDVLHHDLTDDEKKWAGSLVHYAFGTVVGAEYGVLAAKHPAVSVCYGTAYGAALWLVVDEIGVPALGLSEPASQFPLSTHVRALASHLVYGFVTDVTRRALV